MEDTDIVVLYPAPSFPHLVSMVELAKLMVHLNTKLSITILVPPMPCDSESPSSYITRRPQTNARISFISIPDSLHENPDKNQTSRTALSFQIMHLSIPYVLQVLKTISSTSSILALVTSAIHVDFDIHVPVYHYFTSCASALALLLYLPTLHSQTTKSFKDLNNKILDIPGLPLLPASYLPEPVLDRDDPAYDHFLNISSCLSKSKGVILNTFHSLEPRAVKAIQDGTVVSGRASQPIFCVGPLISVDKDNTTPSYYEPSKCLTWLDDQPHSSVVFLCFGSRGIFCEAQLKEIAGGLERSNQRFLWVVKNPLNIQDEPKLEELLPEGFSLRTKERGLVLKSWAPQNAILSHKSIGGFVTHCGWNSILEAICYGVPMVAWPLYAEQKMNSVVLVEEMRLAIPIFTTSSAESNENGEEEEEELVRSEEVEKRIRQLMGSEVGKKLRERCLEIQTLANSAWSKGGSSFWAFSQLIQAWKHE